MEQLRAGIAEVYMDFMIIGPMEEPLIISYFDRSSQVVRAAGASLILDGCITYNRINYRNTNKFDVSYAVIQKDKEKFTHGLAFAENLKEDYLVTTTTDLHKDLYNLLMNKFNLPLLEWWMPEISKLLINKRLMFSGRRKMFYGNIERTIMKNGSEVPVKDLMIFRLNLDEEKLKQIVSMLFQNGKIWITKKKQKKLQFNNLDEYFEVYGKSIVDNLKSILSPISELNGKIDKAVLNSMRPYPQQAAMVNGVYEYFRKKVSDYAILSMGTGSGKTLQGALIVEMMYVGKWLRENPGKTLADAYADENVINYRHFVMCPGHLVKKWRSFIVKQIPYAKPVIIEDFSKFIKLRQRGPDRVNGKEWYIFSKDFMKLSYQRIPTPHKEATRYVEYFRCKDCGLVQSRNNKKCFSCESENIQIVKSRHMRHGLVCPHCNCLIYPTNYVFDMENFELIDDPKSMPLRWYDFTEEKADNQRCIYCDENLWSPFIKNINTEFGARERQPSWIRQTFWANKAKKGKSTKWVLRGYEDEARELYGEVLNSMDDSMGGCRKYSPALYIKKYLKGYIDVFICDEVHKAKGGSTAQGNAFHQIKKASRYTLGLTGTVAGGVATDLFYLLYRMEPKRMKQKGYDWTSVMKFAKDYGCIQTTYIAEYSEYHNKCSRGRQLGQPKVVPGISPLIFSDFLLDRAVFLDIGDMSEHMPPLYEYVKLCSPVNQFEAEMHKSYKKVIDYLREYEKMNEVNLSSVRNQFAMSYLDKPYGVDSILSPLDGDVIITPKDYSALVEGQGLLSKEKLLVDIVNQELEENRYCVVYAEYTQSEFTNVLPRLKKILMEHCNLQPHEVVTMQANYPKAIDREEWMHKQAEYGMKVMICNPRLCETGLDFCWNESGITYNFPTLIFYQSGYSLFVMWQAAGRSWRLNQREECRTYYLAYERTVQQAILQVLGEKKSATSAIQGRFSADGLAAMAKGVDTQVRIAQIMSEMDSQTENALQKMFDVITGSTENVFSDEKTILLFNELFEKVQNAEDVTIHTDLFDMLGAMMPKNTNEQESLFMMFQNNQLNMFSRFNIQNENVEPVKKKRKKKYKEYENCYSLFDF